MSNLLVKYCSRRYAKLLVGPSEITPRTNSRSRKYSLMVGILKTGFPSLPRFKGYLKCRNQCNIFYEPSLL